MLFQLLACHSAVRVLPTLQSVAAQGPLCLMATCRKGKVKVGENEGEIERERENQRQRERGRGGGGREKERESLTVQETLERKLVYHSRTCIGE